MQKFMPGDRVKFLSEKGGGTVKRIINDKFVAVEIEDGFEIPTAVSNLIKIEISPSENQRNTTTEKPTQSQEADSTAPASASTKLKSKHSFTDTGEGVFLAFTPHDQNLLISGLLDVELINRSPFELIYSLFLKSDQGFSGQDYGSLDPASKILISTIERDNLEQWTKGIVQGVWHCNTTSDIPSPLNSSFDIRPLRFLKEDNYKNYNFQFEKCFLIRLALMTELKGDTHKIESSAPKATEVKTPGFISNYMKDDTTAVADLHIDSLVEDTRRLQPAEILNIQLSFFNRILQSAIKEGIQKVIFIHGVGQGILKSEIRKTLETYDFIAFYDASMADYGTGATEARIYQGKDQF